MGGTYAGNAVACAAAVATQKVIREEKLVENASLMGRRLWDGLLEVQRQRPNIIRDVRGPGAMIGLELDAACAATTREKELRHKQECMARQLAHES